MLGELDLTWTVGECIGNVIGETYPVGVNENNTFNSVEIRLNENLLQSSSSTIVALTMLHEALHAKLIAEVYDEVLSTDFKTLYAYYLGWGVGNLDGQQELEILLHYSEEMAKALKDFDQTQGIFNTLDFYKEALKYDFSVQLHLNIYKSGLDEFRAMESSNKKCY